MEKVAINIRLYHENDKQTLTSLMNSLIPQYFNYNELADFTLYLNNEIESYFIIEENKKIIGCGGINIFLDEKLGKISWDMIHPDEQGKKYGSLLLQYRIDLLKQHPIIENIQVRTSQYAYKFYKKHGFELQQIIPNYWAAGYDLYDMLLKK